MTQNAIYLCCIATPWVDVANKLRDENGIVPKYFVHWQDDAEAIKSAGFKDCHLQTVEDLWHGKGFPADVKIVARDEAVRERFAVNELIGVKMMDRLDPDGHTFGFSDRQVFFNSLVGRWIDIIRKHDISLIISPSIPHRVFDYALYVAAKICGTKFLMFQMTSFEKYSFLIEDVETIPSDILAPAKEGSEGELFPEIQARIDRTKGDYAQALPTYMKKQAVDRKNFSRRILKRLAGNPRKYLHPPNSYWVKRGAPPPIGRMSWPGYYINYARRWMKLRALSKTYNARTTSIDHIPKDYIFVALHYQPEETTCPSAGLYYDQVEMIRLLREAVPDDIAIVVKEHKTQFHPGAEGASGRDLRFYDRLSEGSSNLIFVPVDMDPFSLIDKAKLVVTATGTIGWEAAIRGVPVAIFGRAWYENMPGVTRIKVAGDIGRAMNRSGLNAEQLEQAVNSYHSRLQHILIYAEHYKTYADGSLSVTKSVDAILHGIRTKLRLQTPNG